MATTSDVGSRRSKELDKFKRRMIRAVARLMLHEKVPEDEMWAKLKTETGYDCELLWGRMRSVALKKLKRMLAAEDRIELIPRMARMTVTDWLLFDLVLVHEKTDFIATDMRRTKSGEMKPLTDLFSLVQKYEIDGLSGDALAQAWTEATLFYNSQGHHVSPMLLQKRWYQLKETTRLCFYRFWFSYRGNAKLFVKASAEHMPTMLQMAIARRFKEVVTSPFMEWDEMIQKGLIILSEEFDARMRPPKKPIDENAPDLELVEPVIETIDLEDSDTETNGNQQNKTENVTPVLKTTVKTEPIDIVDEDLSGTDNLMNTYPVHDDDDSYETELGRTEGLDIEDNDLVLLDNALENDENVTTYDDSNVSNTLGNYISSPNEEVGVDSIVDESDVVATANNKNIVLDNEGMPTPEEDNLISDDRNTETIETLPQITSVFGNVDISSDHISKINALRTKITDTITNSSSDDDVQLITLNDDVDIKPEIPIIDETSESVPQEGISTVDTGLHEIPIAVKEEASTSLNDIIDKTCESVLKKLIDPPVSGASAFDSVEVKTEEGAPPFGELPSYSKLADDGFELVDDGIAYVEEEMDYKDKIDKINTEDEENESEADAAEEPTEDTAKIDLKLLLYPVVYTTRLDTMGVLDDPYQTVDDKDLLDTILAKSKPISNKTVNFDDIKKENDNAPINDSISDEDEEAYENIITNENRVKLSSYLLQKPRTRNYNPIILCKNPDFNTRLKRLNVGFFSSARNINLLKHCKPLTVDVSKAFESKLVDGTIYLKSSEEDDGRRPEPIDVEREQQASVVPTAMPMQSLIDNAVTHTLTAPSRLNSPRPYEYTLIPERSKVINLPDISQVRRLNQRLLTAEVTPIQMRNNVVIPPSTVDADCTFSHNTITHNNITSLDTPIEAHTAEVVEKNTSDTVTEDLTLKEVDVLKEPITSATPAPIATSNSNASAQGNKNARSLNPMHDLRKKPYFSPWKPREMRPSVTWLSKGKCVNPPVDDALLTTDTLNKMLYLLTQEKDERDVIMQKKAKVLTRKCNKALDKRMGRPPKKQQSDQSTQIAREELSNDDVQIVSETHEKEPPREENPESKGFKDKQPKAKKMCKAKIRATAPTKPRPCCWAQAKIVSITEKRRGIRHKCAPTSCTCCCLHELQAFIKNKCLTHNLGKSCLCIENVVQQTYSTPLQSNIRVTSENRPFRISLDDSSGSECSDTVTESIIEVPSPLTADCYEDVSGNVPPIGAEVSLSNAVSTPKINVTISTSVSDVAPSLVQRPSPSPIPVDNPVQIVNPVPELLPFQKFRYLGSKRQHVVSVPSPSNYSSHNKTETSARLCKCIVPISVDSPHRKIIIDGSSTCPLHKSIVPKPGLNEKQIFLTSKQISQKPSQSPIFLGKNKILLTNVKFPPELKGEVTTPPQAPLVKIIPTLPLPTGVQLVLQSNGELTYTVDSNAPVDPSTLERLPEILEAVKQQLNCMDLETANQAIENASGIQNNEVVTLSDDETSDTNNDTAQSQPVITNINVSNDISNGEASTVPKQSVNVIQNSQDANSTEAPNDDHSNTIEEQSTNEISADVPTEVNKDVSDDQSVASESNSQNNQATEEKDDQSNSENKGAVVPDPSINEATDENKDRIKSKNILSDLMEMSGISAEDATPAPAVAAQPEAVPVPSASSQYLLPQSLQGAIQAAQTGIHPNMAASLSEFSPILSFAELKYACMQNGLFFKLDFETGSIIPINVCIKKHGDNKTVTNKVPASVTIDLTDDDVSDNKSETPPSPSTTRSILIASQNTALHKFTKAKPVKLFKSVHPNILRDTNDPKAYVVKNLESSNNIPKLKRHKRKQDLIKVAARIDMVDSDCPMEEEYLESSGSDGESRKRKVHSDDSSDEEPLSNVAKRMRDVNNDDETPKEANPAAEAADDEVIENFSVMYNEQSENEEDAGDDCILGV